MTKQLVSLIIALVFIATGSVLASEITGGLSNQGSVPVAPSGISARKTGDGQITIIWNAVGSVDGYKVYRKKDSGSFELIAGNVVALNYVNSGLSNGTYSYQIQSFLGSLMPDLNNITPTSPITIVIPTPTPTPSGGGGGGGGGGNYIPPSTPTPTPSLAPLSPEAQAVDVFSDGKIDILDFNVLMGNWGGSGTGDINHDGAVDILDFNMLMANWS